MESNNIHKDVHLEEVAQDTEPAAPMNSKEASKEDLAKYIYDTEDVSDNKDRPGELSEATEPSG